MGEHRLRCHSRDNRMAQAGLMMGFDFNLAFIISRVIPSGTPYRSSGELAVIFHNTRLANAGFGLRLEVRQKFCAAWCQYVKFLEKCERSPLRRPICLFPNYERDEYRRLRRTEPLPLMEARALSILQPPTLAVHSGDAVDRRETVCSRLGRAGATRRALFAIVSD
jgi:hypothetical protein